MSNILEQAKGLLAEIGADVEVIMNPRRHDLFFCSATGYLAFKSVKGEIVLTPELVSDVVRGVILLCEVGMDPTKRAALESLGAGSLISTSDPCDRWKQVIQRYTT